MHEDTRKKTRRTKKYLMNAAEVAELIGCSTSYVKKLRAGIVDNKSPLARRVLAVDLIAEDGSNMLLKEIERIVKLPA